MICQRKQSRKLIISLYSWVKVARLVRSCAFAYLGDSLAYRRKRFPSRRKSTSTSIHSSENATKLKHRELTFILRFLHVKQPVLVLRLISWIEKRKYVLARCDTRMTRFDTIRSIRYKTTYLFMTTSAHYSSIDGKRVSHTRI